MGDGGRKGLPGGVIGLIGDGEAYSEHIALSIRLFIVFFVLT